MKKGSFDSSIFFIVITHYTTLTCCVTGKIKYLEIYFFVGIKDSDVTIVTYPHVPRRKPPRPAAAPVQHDGQVSGLDLTNTDPAYPIMHLMLVVHSDGVVALLYFALLSAFLY